VGDDQVVGGDVDAVLVEEIEGEDGVHHRLPFVMVELGITSGLSTV
jgi:hypothetical protein